MPREMKEHEGQNMSAEAEQTMVTAMFAGSLDEAERCCELLKENGIPATLGESDDDDRSKRRAGIPLLVPEPLLESASEILSARSDDELQDGLDADEDEDEDDDDDDFDDEDEFEAEEDESWDDDDDDDFDDEQDFE